MTKLTNFLGLFLLLILTSCGVGETNQSTTDLVYYPVKAFFEQEIERLEKDKVGVKKTADLNGKEEVKELTEVEWDKELQVFIDSDINKTAWKDKYEIEEKVGKSTNKQKELIYRAKDKKLKTQFMKVIVDTETEDLLYIQITNITNNLIYTAKEVLVYKRNKSYSIEKNQGVKRMGIDKMKILGELIKN